MPWIEGAKLVVRRGMTGATGNIYCGLHEFADMAFVLHMLRPGDLFVDAGANIGSYTVLSSRVAGAKTLAIEPDPDTMKSLARNVAVNGINDRVEQVQCALGAAEGTISFTVGRDTTNRVAQPDEDNVQAVPVARLDTLLAGRAPVLVKMDVEGYEAEVLSGARTMLADPTLLAVESEAESPQVEAIFAEAGFVRRHYNPLSRTFDTAHVGAGGNALFVRDEAACLARVRSAPKRRILGQDV
ncbi:FkbM family methyltransferase [Acuticoccus yangtzensis]|uniref:FkbM family methyltransferase n=1 Tax=Acuticoccus yangtzensis TaxID=1443441 RepID=UPI00196B1895|nr:FkbM family methyltransferase [Acuticoccus yangtzensis]